MKEIYTKEENKLTQGGVNYDRVYESVFLCGIYNNDQIQSYKDKGFRLGGTVVNMQNSYEEVSLYKETLTEIKEPIFEEREYDEDNCICHIVAPCGCCEQKSIDYEED